MSAGQDEAAQIAALETEFQQLNTALGDLGTPADQAWQAVLDELAKGGSTGVQLHVIETEITSELDGNRLHVLPITLRGPFAGLLRTANRLHRTVPEARPVSIRFHTERAGYGGQRALLMTLYLQKIVDENA
ncbi:MAG: hypothetical protein ABI599_15215 [Flavobacteriales bacterium]